MKTYLGLGNNIGTKPRLQKYLHCLSENQRYESVKWNYHLEVENKSLPRFVSRATQAARAQKN